MRAFLAETGFVVIFTLVSCTHKVPREVQPNGSAEELRILADVYDRQEDQRVGIESRLARIEEAISSLAQVLKEKSPAPAPVAVASTSECPRVATYNSKNGHIFGCAFVRGQDGDCQLAGKIDYKTCSAAIAPGRITRHFSWCENSTKRVVHVYNTGKGYMECEVDKEHCALDDLYKNHEFCVDYSNCRTREKHVDDNTCRTRLGARGRKTL